MAWTNPSTRASGYVVTAANWNQDVVANTEFLARPPSVRVRRAAALAIVENGWEEVTFDTESWDTDTMWSSTAATKVFARTAGKYLVCVTGGVDASTGGTGRGIGVRLNSTSGNPEFACTGRESPGGAFSAWPAASGMVSLTTGQYVQLVIYQDHSTTLNTNTADGKPTLSMIWMSS